MNDAAAPTPSSKVTVFAAVRRRRASADAEVGVADDDQPNCADELSRISPNWICDVGLTKPLPTPSVNW